MKTERRSGADQVVRWLVAALLCVLVGHAPAQRSGAADRQALLSLSNNPLTDSLPSSSTNAGTSSALFVPVILTASGQNNSVYTSELTLTNRGGEEATLHYTYMAHAGGGSGKASDRLAPGQQMIEPDALGYLRRLGIPIPHSGNRIGTLQVAVSGSSDLGVSVRTTTLVADGRAGLAYPGIAAADGFQEAVYLCGLRQNSQDRSNVAFQNMGTPEAGPITLRTTLFSGDPEVSAGHVLGDRMLAPGGFYQYNGILNRAGFDNGYVKVERVEGEAPFYAYGVINDNFNSDGSFVFPVTESSLEGATGQTLPVIVETREFTSELTVTNFSEETKTFHFSFVAGGLTTPDRTARFNLTIAAGQQRIIPDVIDTELRRKGVEGVSSTRGGLAGAVFASVASGDMSGIVVGARTSSSDGRGGQYGVFYNAAPSGQAIIEEAWIDGLQQNEKNRSNLALVNTGEVDGSPSVFQLDIYDGVTGMLANTVTGLTVAARGWRQINAILGKHAPGATQGYVRIRKMSGNNPFLAYGVINDGGAPGERSGDGAYLPARERIHDPGADGTADREVLEAFYDATDGASWNNRTNWLSDMPLSEWHGVTTDGRGRVTGLALRDNRLRGGIPTELAGLTRLQRLILEDNRLSGGIPPELAGLTRLRVLSLGYNELSGRIPTELGGLTRLQWLSLGFNQLSGGIPTELGELTHLQWLDLGFNELSGGMPTNMQQLSELTLLDIRDTDVCVPKDAALQTWLATLSRFRSSGLVCDGTRRVLFSASSYEVTEGETVTVSVRLVDLTGGPVRSVEMALTATPGGGATAADYSGVPERVTIMAPATEAGFVFTAVADGPFDDGETVVLGFQQPLPSGVRVGSPETATVTIQDPGTEQITDREVLEALYHATGGPDWNDHTNWLSAAPLSEWFGVGLDDNGRVTSLSLAQNGLSGAIPPALGQLIHLQALNFEFNKLSGAIPPALGQLARLERLNLRFNELSGGIPPELGGLTNLQELNLNFNQLSGVIPLELAQLTNLQELNLNFNQLSGAIPPALSQLTHLQSLDLGVNKLSGTIPPELMQLINLQSLSLWRNQLSGTIPLELAQMTNLRSLDLGFNELSGAILPELGGLTHLQSLALGYNELSGTIPPELAQLTNLRSLDLGENKLSGTIPPELAQLTNLQGLSLRRNELSGVIPRELAQLAHLRSLNLMRNKLSGGIPPELAQLANLQTLDLRLNELSGGIPPELGGLAHLRSLALEGNELSGAIPLELAQLTNLNALTLGFNPDLNGTIPPGLQQLPLAVVHLMATSVCVPEDEELQEWLAGIRFFRTSGLTCGRPAPAMSSIDIAVFYTPAAREIAGGTAEIEADIDLMMVETNQAYLDGGVNQRVALVSREEVEYTESGDSNTDLGRLGNPSDGHLDEVHAIRDQAGADLVHLIADMTDFRGLAGVANPYGLTCAGCDAWIFAHELGHNMGLHHDRYVERSRSFPYSHGYVNQRAFADGAPKSARWKTIMAYTRQCEDSGFLCDELLRFSNPNQTYLGDPLGVPGDERTSAVNGPANAVSALNFTRHSVEAFRPQASGNRLTLSSTLSQAKPTLRPGEAVMPVPGGNLFRAVPPNAGGAASRRTGRVLDRATLRRREVSVDIGSLARVPDGGLTALSLNLFDDLVLTGIFERRTPTYSGGYALSGRLAGVAGGSVTVVVNDSVVAGTVRIPGATYRIRPAGSGKHAIMQIDPSQLPQACETVTLTPGWE